MAGLDTQANSLLELMNGLKLDYFEFFAAGRRGDLDFVADFAI